VVGIVPYPNQFPFTGDIHRIDVELDAPSAADGPDIADGQFQGALKTQ
jgi:hypothetical protein